MITMILELLGLAVQAWTQMATGGAKNTAALTDTLLQIAQKANAAYTAHTGQPIDPSALNPIQPV
jgi:hypothetical protein